jgi:hypothetical protein
MLNLALTQMMRNAFLMTRGRIESEPARRAGYFRAYIGVGSYDPDIIENAALQSFAILTWGEGVPQGREKQDQCSNWEVWWGQDESKCFHPICAVYGHHVVASHFNIPVISRISS